MACSPIKFPISVVNIPPLKYLEPVYLVRSYGHNYWGCGKTFNQLHGAAMTRLRHKENGHSMPTV